MDAVKRKRKILLIGLGVAVTGIAGYFGWGYWQKHKRNKDQDTDNAAAFDDSQAPPKKTFVPTYFAKSNRNDDFPLKKGSKGAKVKALQDALIARYGKDILPHYGADGDFGSETVAALKKLNAPAEIDQNTYHVLVQATAIDAAALAKSLYKDAANQNIESVLASLKKMRSKEDYTAVSSAFENYRLRGVTQTLVNGLLSSFSDEIQKQQIRMEFLRMGLKYDGNKWSLSGRDGFKIITLIPTTVWRTPRQGAKVPAKMILGTEVASRRGYTLFENKGKHFIVLTSCIKYI